jgi:catechol 2,3-dioxygenase-like lactoylglutathione lyase family enzyme
MPSEHRIRCFAAGMHPVRAKAFYENTLGLRFLGDSPFALVLDVGGAMLRIENVSELTPRPEGTTLSLTQLSETRQ